MPATETLPVVFEDVRRAADRIRPFVKRTQVMRSRSFDAQAGVAAFFKCENLQTGGAFKIRGASNFIFSIPYADLPRGVVAYSSGNHAQAVAIAARAAGTKATLVMPADAPRSKMEATRAQGAEIVIYDRFRDDRAAIAARIAQETGATVVPPFDHPWIIAGQGTTALEMLEEVPDMDTLVAPIGGGGLMSGCSIAVKGVQRDIRVIGVEPEAGDDTRRSLEAGERVRIPVPRTIADGQQADIPGELTFAVNRQVVDTIVTVSDAEILDAMAFLFDRMKLVTEPSGASAAAALLAGRAEAGGARVGVVISGGNVGAARFAELMAGR